ncbi:hypothetical protein [Phenylobacterium sp.]|jgi:hypothetical protein|uniref:hypothetical protein n=1 Tax=Phenylobacterium sp. TaxID=1871053 RepID=UPI002F401323
MIGVILAAAVLLADTTAALQPATDAPQPAKPAPAAAAAKPKTDDSTTLICKTEVVVGSRLGVKRCRTKADIDMQRFEDRQALERAQIHQ